jgi:hypothetical protein
MSLKAENLTRIKWKINNFPKMLSELEDQIKKQSDLFMFANHLDIKFAMFFAKERTGAGFTLGVVLKEHHGGEGLNLDVKFWIEDDLGDRTRNWKRKYRMNAENFVPFVFFFAKRSKERFLVGILRCNFGNFQQGIACSVAWATPAKSV